MLIAAFQQRDNPGPTAGIHVRFYNNQVVGGRLGEP
jgi:hypothetical protein